ncbi:hypothetical protein [Haloferax volcanii]|uniref:Uncharacterized protein n=3 Tax=Haloferax volcanii TaxID=2246 RepID=A0A384LG87_HALVD|nr:hypothetical protein [Haloferax volcanii]ADE02129.1 uncharacterized protein HVO_A0236 [Haloferax volcanii DS2]ELY32121.1 hypothetical protein C498_09851 [Haloferax volcanii DS2]MBS8120491.1 hypothetical protein [Haloferax volcanii]MBS8125528.1 hypothetical protein [Haloferax volcanii]MBS8129395.1 hypothetical protein [Haloferax volcanii]
MPHDSDDGTNGEDADDSPRTYREYRRAKGRTSGKVHDDHDAPRSPAEDRDADGPGSGFDGILGAGEDVEKSAQETLEDALDDWDPTGTDVAKGDEERVSLSLSRADIEEASLTTEEKRLRLLEDIRDRLAAIDGPTPSAKQVLREAAADADLSKSANAVDLLESIEDELERQEAVAEAAKDAVEQYVEDGGDLSDPLSEFATFLRGAMPDSRDLDDDGNQARRRALASLAALENEDAGEDGTPA